jgi:hypothetical protein
LNTEESPYNLPYTSQIKQCEEAERMIGYIMDQCKKYGVKLNQPSSIQAFLENLEDISKIKRKAFNLLFDEIYKDIKSQEYFVQN